VISVEDELVLPLASGMLSDAETSGHCRGNGTPKESQACDGVAVVMRASGLKLRKPGE